jgi:hypothetical protein
MFKFQNPIQNPKHFKKYLKLPRPSIENLRVGNALKVLPSPCLHQQIGKTKLSCNEDLRVWELQKGWLLLYHDNLAIKQYVGVYPDAV